MLNGFVFFVYVLCGIGVGSIYVTSLWYTVKKLPEQNKTKIWFLLNAFLRVLFVVGVFYYLSFGDWSRLIAMLIGFMIVRYVGIKKIMKKLKKTVVQQDELELKEV